MTSSEHYRHATRCSIAGSIHDIRDLCPHWRIIEDQRSQGSPFAIMRHRLEWKLNRKLDDGLLQQFLRRTDTANYGTAWETQAHNFFVPKAYGTIPEPWVVGKHEVAPLTRWNSLCSW